MNFLSYVYILLAVLLLCALIWALVTVKIRAKVSPVRVISGLLLATLTGIGMQMFGSGFSAKISSLFIMVAFVTFALWPKGLSEWGVISSLRLIKPYTFVTSVNLTQDKQQKTVAIFHFGAMQIIKLTFRSDLTTIHQFLEQHQVRSIEIS